MFKSRCLVILILRVITFSDTNEWGRCKDRIDFRPDNIIKFCSIHGHHLRVRGLGDDKDFISGIAQGNFPTLNAAHIISNILNSVSLG